jgi:menaquinone-specific isochorismate synthase
MRPGVKQAMLQAWDAARVEGLPDGLVRIAIPCPRIEPMVWLRTAPHAQRFYGATRNRERLLEVAAAGVADQARWDEPVSYDEVLAHLRHTLQQSSDSVRYYGGFRFNKETKPDEAWTTFGTAQFIVPRYEIRSAPEGSLIALHVRREECEDNRFAEWLDRFFDDAHQLSSHEPFPSASQRKDEPDYAVWRGRVEQALTAFAHTKLEKIVLARKVALSYDQRLDPVALLQRLKEATPDCYHFCFMPDADTAFVGASPERLYRREGTCIETEAVAGTRPRSSDPARSAKYAEDLLASEKDQREHAYVRQGIREALTPLCEKIEVDEEPSLLTLQRGLHLYSAVRGTLNPGVDDAAILASLHPTPALGGWPTPEALKCIHAWESFDRGWYAAPVGWISKDAAEFAVGIRSGLVLPNRLLLYSGAGIVKGSTPDNEWDEIEHKISDFIHVLTGL